MGVWACVTVSACVRACSCVRSGEVVKRGGRGKMSGYIYVQTCPDLGLSRYVQILSRFGHRSRYIYCLDIGLSRFV